MSLESISLERLQQIEEERAQTALDPAFHEWMHQLNIGRLCVDKEGIVRAKQMMQQWNNNHSQFKKTV